ncbi:type III pantothenate kinase [Noviherbaspirillum sp.]|uniref:type III pantothenate kinase n=1 Tax=Noviherbaspirillum sp. TaxID=1926288 RepID=UPI002D3F79E1|nr:type III pantothenate kinase [Noviherbaspirillum sp.]HZW23520.1 type III pantothenate kinase [Noviherbaspirillum sp.]
MLLLIDAGNTRVKWAVVPSSERSPDALGRWAESGMVEHAQVRSLSDAWRRHRVVRVLASNVAGQAMRECIEHVLLGAFGMQPVPLEWFASVPTLAGIRNNYRNPGQLGCDRFASAIGAHALFPAQPLVVATCGTATTVDAITADGVFLGGMILPGLGLMANSLAKNTAQLPQVAEHLDIAEPFADHTDAAIVSGCLAAQTGAIERAVAAHARHGGKVECILSGGAAALVSPHLTVPHRRIDNLVLIGLHKAAMNT